MPIVSDHTVLLTIQPSTILPTLMVTQLTGIERLSLPCGQNRFYIDLVSVYCIQCHIDSIKVSKTY